MSCCKKPSQIRPVLWSRDIIAGSCSSQPSSLLSILSPSAPAPIYAGGSKCLAMPSYQCRHQRLLHTHFSMRRLCEAVGCLQGAGWAEWEGCSGALLQAPQPVPATSRLHLPPSSQPGAGQHQSCPLTTSSEDFSLPNFAPSLASLFPSGTFLSGVIHSGISAWGRPLLNLSGSPDFTFVPGGETISHALPPNKNLL